MSGRKRLFAWTIRLALAGLVVYLLLYLLNPNSDRPEVAKTILTFLCAMGILWRLGKRKRKLS